MADRDTLLIDEDLGWYRLREARLRRMKRYLWAGVGCWCLAVFACAFAAETTATHKHLFQTITPLTFLLFAASLLALAAGVGCFAQMLRRPAHLRDR